MKNRKDIKVGIHQPNFFPWLGYFYKMAQSDVFIILDTVDIVLGSAKAITHRVKVKAPNGDKWLVIPLIKRQTKEIQDLSINNQIEWKSKVLNQIRAYYGKAPYFEEVFPFVEECILLESNNLSEYNTNIIKKLAAHLKINTPIVKASELNSKEMDRNQRIIDLVQKVKGNIYLSGKGGASYHDESLFSKNNIQIDYLNFEHPEYPQMHGDFIPGLSSMDYLFNCKQELWK